VSYAAIQDGSGVLASSPGAQLSSWEQDPRLAATLEAGGSGMVFRTLTTPAGPLFEGLSRFPLPDGTTALLRVGVDATSMLTVRSGIEWRHQLLFAVVAMLMLLSIAGTWLLVRWERRRIDAERRLAIREEESRHWQAIGQMASTVAHEVRNPLNTVTMAAQRLRREFQVPDTDQAEYQELLGVLQDETDRVNKVVTDFLDLGRPLALQRERLPARQAVADAVAPLLLRAEREGKHLVVDPVPDGEANVDRHRFGQVIRNLAGNALDAMEEGGTVRIRVRLDPSGMRLTIEDSGPGMDASTLERVQQPFETTKAKGTGLGLPLARRLTEAHGGTLTFDSAPGRGTRAHLHLPMNPDEPGRES
jgi:signal transduction histidine kinase